jgi:hypothetical protein
VTQSTDQQTLRLADILEKNPAFAPTRHHMPPLWDLTQAKGGIPAALRGIIQVAHVPTVNWGPKDVEQDVPEGTVLREIDTNGAFVGAAISGSFAHCKLEHTGVMDLTTGYPPPGYYLVDAHQWQAGAPGSPLGPGRPKLTADGRVWVTHHTYSRLRDLTHGATWGAVPGHWPGCDIYDSWTSDPCKLTKWGEAVRDIRAAAIATGDTVRKNQIKIAYSRAVQMWSTPPDRKGTPRAEQKKKNKIYRPDWYHALRSQHSMNIWYRAYQAVILGHPPLRIWDTDRITITEHNLLALLGRSEQPAPIRMDATGVALGTFKDAKERWYAGIDIEDL